MPLALVRTSLNAIYDKNDFLTKLSSQISLLTGKPENYVMTILQSNIPMTFAGNDSPCCYIEIKSIGSISAKKMSEALCKSIAKYTSIPTDRIYINFQDVKASDWGFNSSTFG